MKYIFLKHLVFIGALLQFFLLSSNSVEHCKAPRIDAPQGNGSLVGPLVGCDCARILALLENREFTVNAICQIPCSGTPITGPSVISAPGYYCLSNDISGPVVINASDVSLDLNLHTISNPGGTALLINAGTNRTIAGGGLAGSSSFVIENSSSTYVHDVIIDGSGGVVGMMGLNSTDMTVVSVKIHGPLVGILLSGTSNCQVFRNINITDSRFGFDLEGTTGAAFENCFVFDIVSTDSVVAYRSFSGTDLAFDGCYAQNLIVGSNSQAFSLNGSNISLKNCIVQGMDCPTGAVGFLIGADNILLSQCSVQDITTTDTSALCFNFSGSIGCVVECIAQQSTGTGFLVEGSDFGLTDCAATNCDGDGFNFTLFNGSVERCQSRFNTNGFVQTGPSSVFIGNRVAVGNAGNGFSVASGVTPIYTCFASGNGTNYVAAINQENANTQVDNAAPGLTGPFARGNIFI